MVYTGDFLLKGGVMESRHLFATLRCRLSKEAKDAQPIFQCRCDVPDVGESCESGYGMFCGDILRPPKNGSEVVILPIKNTACEIVF